MGGACSKYGERRGAYRVLVGVNLRERGNLEDLGIDGKIILSWIFREWEGGHGLN
jgi:hypothetical protein